MRVLLAGFKKELNKILTAPGFYTCHSNPFVIVIVLFLRLTVQFIYIGLIADRLRHASTFDPNYISGGKVITIYMFC